jgi:hypothetical protein
MAVSLTKYLNSKLKAMGKTAAQAKKNASKYKSIAAAKKAGSLYYTNKDGKVMAAVFAEDLKKPIAAIKPPKKPSQSRGPTTRPTMPNRQKKYLERKEKAELEGLNKEKRMTGAEITEAVLNAIKKPKGQSAAFNAFFKKNKAKYKKDNGGFNTRQALKDFNARSK